MKGPRTAGYHHHQFKIIDELKRPRALKAQEGLINSFCLIAVSVRPPPRYVTAAPLIVFYLFFGINYTFRNMSLFMSFVLLQKYLITEE